MICSVSFMVFVFLYVFTVSALLSFFLCFYCRAMLCISAVYALCGVCASVCLSVCLLSPDHSTQLNWLSWVESDLALWSQPATRLNSTDPVVTSSVILNIWPVCPVEFELSCSNDHSARSNSTQLNQVTFQSRPGFLFHRVGKVKNKNNFYLFKRHALLCNAAMY